MPPLSSLSAVLFCWKAKRVCVAAFCVAASERFRWGVGGGGLAVRQSGQLEPSARGDGWGVVSEHGFGFLAAVAGRGLSAGKAAVLAA